MNDKIVVLRKENSSNDKKWIYTLHDSIYDIKKNSDNLYIFKKLVELEKLLKGTQDFSYELKMISDVEYETRIFNMNLNDQKVPECGSFISFLVNYTRELDSLYHNKPSDIYLFHSNHESIKNWALKTIKKVNNKPKK